MQGEAEKVNLFNCSRSISHGKAWFVSACLLLLDSNPAVLEFEGKPAIANVPSKEGAPLA